MKNKLFKAITVFPKLFQNYLPGIASAQSENRTFPFFLSTVFQVISTFKDKEFVNIFQQQKNAAPIIWIQGTGGIKIFFFFGERKKISPLSFSELFLPKKKGESKYASPPFRVQFAYYLILPREFRGWNTFQVFESLPSPQNTYDWRELGPSLLVYGATFLIGVTGNGLILVRNTYIVRFPKRNTYINKLLLIESSLLWWFLCSWRNLQNSKMKPIKQYSVLRQYFQ